MIQFSLHFVPHLGHLALALVLAACTGLSSVGAPGSERGEEVTPASLTTKETAPPTAGRDARAEAVVSDLLRAYNAGQIHEVMALVDDEITWSDCDYGATKAFALTGKDRLADWLQRAFTDHDSLDVMVIRVTPGTPPVGEVIYRRRTSDTLRSLGFPDGIKPKSGTKVALTPTSDRILAFANGPSGGPHGLCRPEG